MKYEWFLFKFKHKTSPCVSGKSILDASAGIRRLSDRLEVAKPYTTGLPQQKRSDRVTTPEDVFLASNQLALLHARSTYNLTTYKDYSIL